MNKLKLRILIYVMLMITLNVSAVMTSVNADIITEEIVASEDANINQINSGVNYGSETLIRVELNQDEGFIFFDLSTIIDKNYTSAMLGIYVGESTLTHLNVYPVAQAWSEEIITWDLAPVVNTSISVTKTLPVRGGYHYINVTSIVSNWTTGIIPNYGFNLKSSLNFIAFYSKEYSDESRHPILTFEIIEPSQNTSSSIPGFEIVMMVFGMIGVIFLIVKKKKRIKRKNC